MEATETHPRCHREHCGQRESSLHGPRCYLKPLAPAGPRAAEAVQTWFRDVMDARFRRPGGLRTGSRLCCLLMAAYLDCFACACLVRASDSSCPFCGTSLRVVSAVPSRLGLGLVLGVGLTLFGCGDKEGDTASETVADSNADANDDSDAVTYAGPDDFTDTTPGNDTILDDSNDDSDAVTYAGPDETSSTGTG